MKPTSLLLTLSFLSLPLLAQDAPGPPPADPFVKEKKSVEVIKPKDAVGPETHINVGVLIQFIDVKRERWTDWLSKNSVPLNATALRKEVEGWMGTGEAELAETSLVMGQSGGRMKVESVRGMFYATEFDELEGGGLPFPTRSNLATSARPRKSTLFSDRTT